MAGTHFESIHHYPPGESVSVRISEKMRIAGSLVFMLILFILTAILVKVPMEQDHFFSITMATIWFINCKYQRSFLKKRLRVGRKCLSSDIDLMCVCSFWSGAAGKPFWPGRLAASEIQRSVHEWTSSGRSVRRSRHAVRHRK